MDEKISIIKRHGDDKDLAKLYSKLAKASKKMSGVSKNGHNAEYSYVKADDIFVLATDVLSDLNIMLLTSTVDKDVNHYKNSKGNTVTEIYIEREFSFNCGDTGAYITLRYMGYDRDSDDKVLYKAFTGATKYFLKDNFLIDTGDPDPEITHDNGDNYKKDNKIKKSNKNKSDKKDSNKTDNDKVTKITDEKETNDEPNKTAIRELFKSSEHKDLVRETILEYLKEMGYEPNLKELSKIDDDALDVLLVEIEERIKEDKAS